MFSLCFLNDPGLASNRISFLVFLFHPLFRNHAVSYQIFVLSIFQRLCAQVSALSHSPPPCVLPALPLTTLALPYLVFSGSSQSTTQNTHFSLFSSSNSNHFNTQIEFNPASGCHLKPIRLSSLSIPAGHLWFWLKFSWVYNQGAATSFWPAAE